MKICLLSTDISLCSDEFEQKLISLDLGINEEARLKSIKNAESAKQSLIARLALKELCDGIEHGNIARDENGKPYFEIGAVHFSLSHTKTIAAAVITDKSEGRVGIDVEEIRTDRNTNSIAARFFDPDELDEFKFSDKSFESFYSLWTKKEARAKLFGHGLSVELYGKKSSDKEIYYRQYALRTGTTRAILCVATEQKISEIKFIQDKEIEIYEL